MRAELPRMRDVGAGLFLCVCLVAPAESTADEIPISQIVVVIDTLRRDLGSCSSAASNSRGRHTARSEESSRGVGRRGRTSEASAWRG